MSSIGNEKNTTIIFPVPIDILSHFSRPKTRSKSRKKSEMTKKEAPDTKTEEHDSVKENQEIKATGKLWHRLTIPALCVRFNIQECAFFINTFLQEPWELFTRNTVLILSVFFLVIKRNDKVSWEGLAAEFM